MEGLISVKSRWYIWCMWTFWFTSSKHGAKITGSRSEHDLVCLNESMRVSTRPEHNVSEFLVVLKLFQTLEEVTVILGQLEEHGLVADLLVLDIFVENHLVQVDIQIFHCIHDAPLHLFSYIFCCCYDIKFEFFFLLY